MKGGEEGEARKGSTIREEGGGGERGRGRGRKMSAPSAPLFHNLLTAKNASEEKTEGGGEEGGSKEFFRQKKKRRRRSDQIASGCRTKLLLHLILV